MEAGGIPPAGSARALRLDPFALPVRYPAKDLGERTGKCARWNLIANALCCGVRCAACA